MWTEGWPRAILAALLVTIVSVTLAACGGDDDDDATGAAGDAATTTEDGAKQDRARAAAEQVAGDAGEAELPQDLSVGIVNFQGEAESGRRAVEGLENAIAALGWESSSCEGEGDPAKVATCAQRQLNNDPDVMVSIAIPGALMTRQMQEADRRDIPWFNITSVLPDRDKFTGSYSQDDPLMAKVINEFMFEKMEEEGATTLAASTLTEVLALKQRFDVLSEDLKEHPDIELVAKNPIDLTAPESITTQARTTFTANPDLGAYWTSLDFELPRVAAAATAAVRGGDRPIIVGFFANQVTMDPIRKDEATAVVEVPIEALGWVVTDQAAGFLARDEKPSEDEYAASNEYPLDFMQPVIVTKDNLPPEGEYLPPSEDFVTFFKTKWNLEYGTTG